METKTAGVTVKAVVPDMAPEAAVMVAIPAPALVATPWLPGALLMAATVEADDDHTTVAVRACVLPSVNVPVAANC